MRYAIRNNKWGNYISYCTKEFWHESTNFPVFAFTKEEAEEAVKILETHYVYNVTLIAENGEETTYNALSTNKPKIKSKGFKFKLKI